MSAKLVEALHRVGDRYDSPAAMVADDLLLRFSVFYYQVPQVTYKYFLVSSVAFRGGRQPAMQSYCLLEPVEGQETVLPNQVILQIAQHPHVRQSKAWPNPINRGSDELSGCPITFSTQQLAALLAQMKSDTIDSLHPYKFVIRKLKFNDLSRSRIQVLEYDSTWNPIVVSSSASSQSSGSGGGVAPIDAQPKGRPKGKTKQDPLDILNFGDDLDDLVVERVDGIEDVLGLDTHDGVQAELDKTSNDDSLPCREEIMEQLLAALDFQASSELELNADLEKHVQDFVGLLGKEEMDALEEVGKSCADAWQPVLESEEVSWFCFVSLVSF